MVTHLNSGKNESNLSVPGIQGWHKFLWYPLISGRLQLDSNLSLIKCEMTVELICLCLRRKIWTSLSPLGLCRCTPHICKYGFKYRQTYSSGTPFVGLITQKFSRFYVSVYYKHYNGLVLKAYQNVHSEDF